MEAIPFIGLALTHKLPCQPIEDHLFRLFNSILRETDFFPYKRNDLMKSIRAFLKIDLILFYPILRLSLYNHFRKIFFLDCT